MNWNASHSKLEEVLTDLGIEVEASQPTLASFQDVVVGFVKCCRPHPDADKLKLCEVDVSQSELLTIVCGAPNVSAGMKVPVALPEAILPFGQLKPRKIRGVFSQGMICSEEELGFAEKSDGIWVLDENYEIGEDFRSYFEEDIQIELSITPNRPDWLGLRGVLRELSVKTGIPYKLPNAQLQNKDLKDFQIKIEDSKGCPRYVGALIRGVKIEPSPRWLQQRLKAVGQRSINNVVDLTNYLMILYGHPMHAFDASKIRGKQIIVRQAREGESLQTLDGEDRKFDSNDLLICDTQGPSAIAGVMGGADSEIDDNTTDVFLEVAYFDPVRIRKTSKKQKMHTEASHRFERGMDIEFPNELANIAIEHVLEIAGGFYAGTIDAYPKTFTSKPVKFSYELITKILGITPTSEWVNKTLEKFGCGLEQIDELNVLIYPPSFRHDLERPIDVVEEIARIYGYNEIPFEAPRSSLQLLRDKPLEIVVEKTRQALLKESLSECVTYSFAREKHPDSVELLNPLAEDVAYLRTNITDKLLETTINNYKKQNSRIGLFETGVVFSKKSDAQYVEEFHLCIAISGIQINDWKNKNTSTDFFDLKGIVERLFAHLHHPFQWRESKSPHHRIDKAITQDIYFQGKPIGFAGLVENNYLKKQKIFSPVAICELNLDPIISAKEKMKKFKPLPILPGAEKQLALITPKDIQAEQIMREISKLKIKNLENYQIFDLYEGKGISENHKSLGVSFYFRGSERSLSEEEMGQQLEKILETLSKKYNITLRP